MQNYPRWFDDALSFIAQMNRLDWLLMSYLILAMLLGFWRGLVKEVFILLTWLISIGIALIFMPKFSHLLTHLITFPSVRFIVALLTLFLISMILFGWFGDLVVQSMRLNRLSLAEHFLGMILGGIRGLVSLAFIIILGSMTQLIEISDWKQSLFIHHIGQAAQFLINQLR
jgi:membrane protein required for colicin V production